MSGSIKTVAVKTGSVKTDSVIHGDCIEVMAGMKDGSVDMVFADPPYNLQLPGTQLTRPDESEVDAVLDDWDRFDSNKAYDDFSRAWLREARRVLKPDGTIWVIGAYHNIYRIGTAMQDSGFWILNDVIWRKCNPMPNFRGRRFTNAHETLIWAAKENKAPYTFNYQSMKIFNDGVQMRSDDWLVPICNGDERIRKEGIKAHSTQKPEALMMRVLMAASNPGDVILDPFTGSGTTGAVAKRLRRRFIGIEANEDYVAVARERIDAVVPVDDENMLAVPSRRDAVKIPFGVLVSEGMINPGDTLVARGGEFRARVRADGSLVHDDNNDELPLDGSIHSLGARLQNRTTCNGWDFWSLEGGGSGRAGGGDIPIDDLRRKMRLRMEKN